MNRSLDKIRKIINKNRDADCTLTSNDVINFSKSELMKKITEGHLELETPIKITDNSNSYLKCGNIVTLLTFLACVESKNNFTLLSRFIRLKQLSNNKQKEIIASSRPIVESTNTFRSGTNEGCI